MRLLEMGLAVAALIVAPGPGAWGQDPGGAGWGPGTSYGRLYDAATVETVRGTVAAVRLINPRKGMACGVCLSVEQEDGPLCVHLGPEAYVGRQAVHIFSGDVVEVTGSRVVFKGEPVILAARVRKRDQVLVLRDERGLPAWGGGRRREKHP